MWWNNRPLLTTQRKDTCDACFEVPTITRLILHHQLTELRTIIRFTLVMSAVWTTNLSLSVMCKMAVGNALQVRRGWQLTNEEVGAEQVEVAGYQPFSRTF